MRLNIPGNLRISSCLFAVGASRLIPIVSDFRELQEIVCKITPDLFLGDTAFYIIFVEGIETGIKARKRTHLQIVNMLADHKIKIGQKECFIETLWRTVTKACKRRLHFWCGCYCFIRINGNAKTRL